MYTVYADDRLLYHPQLINEGYAIGSPVLTLEVNHSGSFTFTLMPTNRLYNYLTKMTTIITVYDNDEEIFRGRILNDEKDAYNRKNVYCEGELAFLLDSILRPYEFSGSITDYLTMLLNTHNEQVDKYKQFKVGNITVLDPNDYIVRGNTEYVDIWTELTDKLIGYLGGYISVRIEEDGRYIDYLEEYIQSDDQIIEFGVNMIDITQYITAEYLCTRLIPLGAYDENNVRITIASVNNGKDYIENETGISLFDKITKTYIWEDVTEPANLLKKAKEYLEANIEMSVSLTIKAIDLHLLDVNVNRIKKGYSYRILSAPHALDSYFDCTKVVLKLTNPDNNEYTLGSSYTSLTEQQISTNKGINLTQEQVNVIKEKSNTTESIVKDVQQTVNTVYDNYTELTKYIDNLKTIYATIDFANIGSAAIEKLFSDFGLIKDLQIVNGTITGTLTGVKITGDVIESNTIVADSLILKGSDGLYYKLNEIGGNLTAEQLTDEKYQSALDGSNIVAESITANKLSVTSLSSISANIGAITAGSLDIGNHTFVVTNDGILTAKGANIYGKMFVDSKTTKTYDFTSDDLTKIQNVIMETETATEDDLKRFDVTGDGYISPSDYTWVRTIINADNSVNTTFLLNPEFGSDVNRGVLEVSVEGMNTTKITHNGSLYTTQASVDVLRVGTLSADNYMDTYSNSLTWTGKYDGHGRKIYSLFWGEIHVGTGVGGKTYSKTFDFTIQDAWIDNQMSYFAIANGSNWEFRFLNTPTSGTNSQYISEAWIDKLSGNTTLQLRLYFGSSRTADKYVQPYILLTKVSDD